MPALTAIGPCGVWYQVLNPSAGGYLTVNITEVFDKRNRRLHEQPPVPLG